MEIDGESFDSDGDGVDDAVAYDSDGDGAYDTVELDSDGNGVLDTIVIDEDGDGYADVIGIDVDEDGVVDEAYDGDGNPIDLGDGSETTDPSVPTDTDTTSTDALGGTPVDLDGDGVTDATAYDLSLIHI